MIITWKLISEGKEDAPTLVDTHCFLLTVVDEDVFVLIVGWMFALLFVNVVI